MSFWFSSMKNQNINLLRGSKIIQFIYIILFLAPLILGCILMGPQKNIELIHPSSGLRKSGFVGYSWTYFFFGFFVPIFRGEIGIGALHLILSFVTFGIFQLIMPFLYNKQYSTRLLVNGWILNDTEEINKFAQKKLGIK
jgi:hypothetical protein